jgi:CRISPR system Cascade subunit CasB
VSAPHSERRYAFVKDLHVLHAAAESGNAARQAASRRTLAGLRRGLVTGQPQLDAHEIVFRHDPPDSELEVWLLIAGLFATNPHRTLAQCSLGTSMRALQELRGDSATRRFDQLLQIDRAALPHHLRQIIRLLASDNIPINYAGLLDDLVLLLGDNRRDQAAHRVRLRWARDFHTAPTTKTTTTTATTD